MKVLSNTIDFDCYTWEDPGDYPNAVAARALPSYPVCECSGQMVIKAETDEDLESLATIDDWFGDWVSACSESPLCGSLPFGWSIKWKITVEGDTVFAEPIGAEVDDDREMER